MFQPQAEKPHRPGDRMGILRPAVGKSETDAYVRGSNRGNRLPIIYHKGIFACLSMIQSIGDTKEEIAKSSP